MNNGNKLLELCGITKSQKYREPRTGEELLQTGRNYLEQYEKAAALDEAQLQRIRSLYSLILAQALQPRARSIYQSGDSASISQLLESEWQKRGEQDWQKQRVLINDALAITGLSPEQIAVLGKYFDEFPALLREFIAAEAGRLKLVPVENIGEVATVLAEMYREGNNAEQV